MTSTIGSIIYVKFYFFVNLTDQVTTTGLITTSPTTEASTVAPTTKELTTTRQITTTTATTIATTTQEKIDKYHRLFSHFFCGILFLCQSRFSGREQ